MDITTIIPIRAFQDNYIWCLRRGSNAVVVDPGDAEPVLEYLSGEGLQLAAILATHHHGDHVGGNTALLAKYNVPVFGPAREDIPGATRKLREGDVIKVPGIGLDFQVIDVPGHTTGHIAYYGDGVLFCGDTLVFLRLRQIVRGHGNADALVAIKTRSGNREVATSAGRFAGRALTDPLEVFATLRKWKDGF